MLYSHTNISKESERYEFLFKIKLLSSNINSTKCFKGLNLIEVYLYVFSCGPMVFFILLGVDASKRESITEYLSVHIHLFMLCKFMAPIKDGTFACSSISPGATVL